MSLFLRDSNAQIVGEYKDLKEIQALARAGRLLPGAYTILKVTGSFSTREVPARLALSFESASKRGPRKPKAEGEAPVAEKPSKKKGLFGN